MEMEDKDLNVFDVFTEQIVLLHTEQLLSLISLHFYKL